MVNVFKQFANNITDTINGVVKLITPSQKSFEYDISNLNDIWAVNNSRILLSNFMDYLLNKRCIKRLWINEPDWIKNFMNDNNVIAFCTEEKSIVYMKYDKNGAEIGGKIHINDLSSEDLKTIIDYLNKYPLLIYMSDKIKMPNGNIDEYSATLCKGRMQCDLIKFYYTHEIGFFENPELKKWEFN